MAESEVRHCRTADGAVIAWNVTGDGPPLIVPSSFMSEVRWQD